MMRVMIGMLLGALLSGPETVWSKDTSVSVPAEWKSVKTAEIARWKKVNRAPKGVVTDVTARTVTFLAEATGVTMADTIEFLLIGPLSDRGYESFAISVADPDDIAEGLEKIGLPLGRGVDSAKSLLWPQGESVRLSAQCVEDGKRVALADLLADTRAAEEGPLLKEPLVATLGTRDGKGFLLAATNMPCAIFALFNHGPSLLQFDGAYDQSGIYGRFRPARSWKAGTLFAFTVAWDGARRMRERTITLATESDAARELAALRAAKDEASLYVKLAFDPRAPLARAVRSARAFSLVDGKGVRMNGCAPGQFFYQAYLPEPDWRRREGRLYQPFEVHVKADGTRLFVHVEEDFSGPGTDPVLKPHETPFKEWSELPALIARTRAEKVDLLFIFAPPETPVGTFLPIIPVLGSRIATYYLFETSAVAEK